MVETGAAMEAEFDDVPGWTAEAVERLGPGHAVPAACRGSASPAALDWLSEHCDLREGTVLVDVGGGMGGPAAYAREHGGARAFVVDPMPGACRAAQRLFGMPAVVGTGGRLPIAAAVADAVWCVGVLCTTTEKLQLLREIRRVLKPGGRVGLFVLLATTAVAADAPEGNDFPTDDDLVRLSAAAGLRITDAVDLADLPPAPGAWRDRITAVDEAVREQHGHEPPWRTAQEQERLLTRLLEDGRLRGRLLAAEIARPQPAGR